MSCCTEESIQHLSYKRKIPKQVANDIFVIILITCEITNIKKQSPNPPAGGQVCTKKQNSKQKVLEFKKLNNWSLFVNCDLKFGIFGHSLIMPNKTG